MIRVINQGFGVVGRECARFIYAKEGMDLVGCIDRNPKFVGKDVGEEIGIGKTGVIVSDDADAVLSINADVLVDSTGSFVKEIYPQIRKALDAGLDVVTVAEDFTFPWIRDTKLGNELDQLAKKRGVTLIAGGVEPGFIGDVLVAVLSSVFCEVKKVKIHRVWDATTFVDSPHVIEAFGLGQSIEEAQKKMVEYSKGQEVVVMHVGMDNNFHQIAQTLGWKLDKWEVIQKPLPSQADRVFPNGFRIEKGTCYGCSCDGYAKNVNGETVIEFSGGITVGQEPGDVYEPGALKIEIEGTPGTLTVDIKGLCGGPAEMVETRTAAHAVNWIPLALKARPGLITDLREHPMVYCVPTRRFHR